MILLAIYYLNSKAVVYLQNERVIQSVHRTQALEELHGSIFGFMLRLNAYVDKYGQLPENLEGDEIFSCSSSWCPTGEWNYVYYFQRREHWVAVEPFLVNDELDYECWISLPDVTEQERERFNINPCGFLDVAAIPQFH
ncbi:MAG: hypothetical protein CVV10_00425 [Gammaproteobacteria bacterium HGW-Gammaproteobacteria-14]|nr:MAG: hypothetical protein CVV10_00425 [Gammaproteobacteria bacterium HGW-Gammaproteobacteria-14]